MKGNAIDRGVRWAARTAGVAALALAGAVLSAEGLPRFEQLGSADAWMFVSIAVALVGVPLAFRWPLAGASLVLAGFASLVVLDPSVIDSRVFLVLPTSGALFAVSSLLARAAEPPHRRPASRALDSRDVDRRIDTASELAAAALLGPVPSREGPGPRDPGA